MYEQWQPLGVVGVISAFNFPVAVWAWNAALAVVCGDPVIWKPSHKVPLAAIAVQNICHRLMIEYDCPGLFSLVMGSVGEVGERMLHDPRLPLISATGSTRMGRRIAEIVGPRMGRTILELGGNNAIVVLDDADLDLAVRAVTFAACGTAGQRCTTTRRLVVQKGVAKDVVERLKKIYASVRIGDPLDSGTLMGPLVDEHAVADYLKAIETAKADGGTVLYGGKKLDRPGHFVEPTIIAARADMKIVHEETFAPILYVLEVKDVDEAIAVNNGVPQGLSSAIFTRDVLAAEKFLSAVGSDCGIANVNIGTSGAEIGGAFGGEKDTGGGREAGSDSWKLYMRRQTVTINYGKELPLAQGVHFDV
jgi:aldehyde dehydrogenase (NAD+)